MKSLPLILSLLSTVLYLMAPHSLCLAENLKVATNRRWKPMTVRSDPKAKSRLLAEAGRLQGVGIHSDTDEYNRMVHDYETLLERHSRSAGLAGIPDVISMAKDGVDAAHGMIGLYNKMVNLVIPWTAFEKTMNELKEVRNHYSNEAAEMVGQIQSLLLDSSDQYHSSKEEVIRWCKFAVPVLGQYMSLFRYTNNSHVAEAQKILLLKVLNDGAEHVSNAMIDLETSRLSFNNAYGHLTALKTRLHNEFSEGSSFYVRSVSKLRAKAYAGAAAGVVLGPLGLYISYGIAAGVVEGRLIPELEEAFEQTKQQFDDLQMVVERAQNTIDSTKGSITEEIEVLGIISAKIEQTKSFAETWALLPSILFNDLKKSTTELIDMCRQYVVTSKNNQ